ncbi:MAG: nitronate monooxygenase [Deltaproteobacteria bacterium]|nr:nitronate monooxygenase [Deltaproteobacteria bacterium]MBW2359425.1 nitronate monooxygenase [Deltaproteobacteria bacterium]
MSPALKTRVTELLGSSYPIIQTGMGWVSTPELVAGVCNGGGFGFLGAATIPPDDVESEILRLKELTDAPFGVNFLMDAPGADVIIAAIVRQGVKAAGYNRAPNAELIQRLKDGGVVCVPTCGAVKHALKAEKLGADIIIVQGSEGGGHTGATPTSLLVSAAADAVSVPILAAGGFRDGRGLVAALALGAEGIAMGTRFLLTRESPVPEITTDRYLAASVDDVIVTREIDGLPQRVVTNELVDELAGKGPVGRLWLAFRSALELRRLTGASIPELLKSGLAMRKNQRLTRSQMLLAANAPMLAKLAMNDGDPVNGYLPSGSVAGMIDDRPTCAELVGRMVEEAELALKQLGA